jgi:hypothetical protein
MKIDRLAVYNKYRDSAGLAHCSYCGKILPSISIMQIDHIIPKARGWKVADVNDISNILPSCASCNRYKSNHSLEGFRRKYLGMLHERLARQFTVKIAIDYGIVKLNKWDKLFYYEKVKG